jgi:serine protease Do
VTEAHLRDYALPDTAGALVLTVEPGSPAAQAGIRPHDVIMQWDGHPIRKWTDLFTRVAATQVGTEVSVQIRRASDLRELQVVVSERPPEAAM